MVYSLVEEFMLLANMASARLIYNGFPDRALLRRHPPPNDRKLTQAVATLAEHEINVESSSFVHLL